MSRTNIKNVENTTDIIETLTAAELGLNVLYLDLNSCFATTEQQARPKLRGHPVAITNRLVENSTIIAASYEAKARGVGVGCRRREAAALCPGIIFVESEPSKYIYVHQKLKSILQDYSPSICMKSVDEGLIDLQDSPIEIKNRPILEIAREIKMRIKVEIGCYMRCNIGLGANRFLAKLAAELHKPDGLDMILTYDILLKNGTEIPANQRQVFSHLKLTDLPGINVRMQKRLNTYQIYTPLELLDAPEDVLRHQVCRSIDGIKWYERLRGVEVDELEDVTKSIGRQFVLPPDLDNKTVELYLAHLCEDVGFRLRQQDLYARSVYVAASASNGMLHDNITSSQPFHGDQDIIKRAVRLYRNIAAPYNGTVRLIIVSVYNLQNDPGRQMSIFDKEENQQTAVAKAVDQINIRFGARTIHSTRTLGTEDIKQKIPFGSTRYLNEFIGD